MSSTRELPRVLAPILAAVERRNTRRRERIPLEGLAERLDAQHPRSASASRRRAFRTALVGGAPALVAECKRRSPSAGTLVGDEDVLQRALSYARGGAAALSVLTEPDHFGGRRAHLVRARAAGLPVLRKDFVVDGGMLLESAVMGADAVLLIARCHPPKELARLVARAHELDLATLVEIHADDEVGPALDAGSDAIGVNARDLDTLVVDVEGALALLARLPRHVVRVAESGLASRHDLERARAAGADAVLVGTALVGALDPETAVRTLLGRSEVRA